MAATEIREIEAARRLRFEQKSNSLLRELVSRFCHPVELVLGLVAITFSTVLACFTVPASNYLLDVRRI